ncbi:nuclear transport factor 2 family protein [Nocardia yamanashiensis]|uniref:nuclear transport factor 2 family protein n=1 Tax=Nocardia yamanashiensis TaxID=209247 RepID=UPI000837301F|nr:nuclear transport factor 2 family protein [Nocardia yamanashiensis]UGT41337.1 nuclear transport factor 2 family protein [Nocardia yamanashiensis]
MDDTVTAVMHAVESGDWARFAQLVHPYVHWTEDGVTTRGRTRVMALLSGRGVKPAATVELRDGQVYRWNA